MVIKKLAPKVGFWTNQISKISYKIGPNIHDLSLQLEMNLYRFKSYALDEYETAPDPLKVFWIPPEEIVNMSGRNENLSESKWPPGQVQSGAWDKRTRPFQSHWKYNMIEDRFVNRKPWDEIEEIQELIAKVKQGDRVWHGCTSINDIQSRCKYLDNLFKDVDQNGYKSQQSMICKKEKIGGFKTAFQQEIMVDISRNGKFLYLDGAHRLSIAKILDLSRIPVVVVARHSKWMEYRENLTDINHIPDHDDLMDLK